MKINLPKILTILCWAHLTSLIILGTDALSLSMCSPHDLSTYALHFITILSYGYILINILKKER